VAAVYVDGKGTFTKQASGIIYGSDASDSLKNTAVSDSYGHAVYVDGSPAKLRNATAGFGATLDSAQDGSAGGWETLLSSSLSLVQSLKWIEDNAEDGDVYTITIKADDDIAPQPLDYGGKKVSITLHGGTTERTVRLSSYQNGSLFTLGDRVTLTLGNNVTLQGRSNNTTGLVRVNGGGTLVMESGSKITGNNAYTGSNTDSNGGGVCMESGAAFTMNGGTISNNIAVCGGGVYVYNSAAFTMNGGTISDNTAVEGGGVSVHTDGRFTMKNGIISGNTASRSGTPYIYSSGGGVDVRGGGTFTKTDGIIYGSDAGDGLKNTALDGDVYGHAVYVISSPMAKLRHTTSDGTVRLDSAVSGAAGGWEPLPPPGLSLADSLAWIKSNAVDGGVYTITIKNDEPIAPQELYYTGVNNVNITLVGETTERTVSLNSSGSLFTIGSGVTLTLVNNVSLQGRDNNTASLVRVNGGMLVMESGSKISGNNNTSSGGGGVFVTSSGTFTMNGGAISENSTPDYGGGVYVYESGTFTLNGGTISRNNASYGGGVEVFGTFTLSGGTISRNNASSSGGGVDVDGSGTFTMSDGTISGNTASEYGGGVVVWSGTFTKSIGIIYGSNETDTLLKNTANGNSYGHAVYIDSSPSKKRNNTADASVALDSGVSGSANGWE
jgi:hypothetical protein